MTPAETLRGRVVTIVVGGILGLSAGLYGLVGFLLITAGVDSVPDALWLAAGTQSGVLGTILLNSRGEDSGPIPVTTAPGDAVTVEYDDPEVP